MGAAEEELEGKIEFLKEKMESILKTGEHLSVISFSQSHTSFYPLFKNEDDTFLCFRISSHRTNAYYSNKTWDLRKFDDTMLQGMRKFLDSASWYKFTPEDYMTIRYLNFLAKSERPIYIDNTMNIFYGHKMGILFYQVRKIRKNRKEIFTVSEELQHGVRKLFAEGLVNGYKNRNGEILVYVTACGRYMTEEEEKEHPEYRERYFDFVNRYDLYSKEEA